MGGTVQRDTSDNISSINFNSNVGIGTNNPLKKLHVKVIRYFLQMIQIKVKV